MMASKLPKADKDFPNGPWCPLVLFLSVTKNKVTVFYDVYISIIFEISLCTPSSSTDISNTNKNELDELVMIALKPINILMAKSEIKNSTLAMTFHKPHRSVQ